MFVATNNFKRTVVKYLLVYAIKFFASSCGSELPHLPPNYALFGTQHTQQPAWHHYLIQAGPS